MEDELIARLAALGVKDMYKIARASRDKDLAAVVSAGKKVTFEQSPQGTGDVVTVEGYLVAPGLVVTRQKGNYWRVALQQSGLWITNPGTDPLKTRAEATIFALRLNALRDWSKPLDEIKEDKNLTKSIAQATQDQKYGRPIPGINAPHGYHLTKEVYDAELQGGVFKAEDFKTPAPPANASGFFKSDSRLVVNEPGKPLAISNNFFVEFNTSQEVIDKATAKASQHAPRTADMEKVMRDIKGDLDYELTIKDALIGVDPKLNVYYWQLPDGSTLAVDSKYFNYFTAKGASLYGTFPVAAIQGNTISGIIMPIRTDIEYVDLVKKLRPVPPVPMISDFMPAPTLSKEAFIGEVPPLQPQNVEAPIPLTSRRDIVNYLQKSLDIPIRIGRYRGKAAGIFKVKPEVIRTRLANNLPVIAHEVGHYLDKKLGLSDKAYDAELLKLGEPRSAPTYSKEQIRKEGVAEFMRLYLTNPTAAQEMAPRYSTEFAAKMSANPDIHDVLLQARSDIYNWANQPAKARILGHISIGDRQQSRKMSLDRLYTTLVDELYPIEKFVKEIAGEDISIEDNPFLQAWLSRGWVGKAETFLHHGVVDKKFNKIGPSLKEVLQPAKGRLDDFRAYIVAKRAEELHARGLETGMDHQDVLTVIKELESPAFKKALEELVIFQEAVLDRLVESGVIDLDAVKAMRAMNQQYVPFYRVFEEMGTHAFGISKYANVVSPIKRMKGSARDVIDPLESIIKNTFFIINVAERNNVGRLIVELAEKKEGAGKWVEKVDAPIKATTFELGEIKNVLELAGVDTQNLDIDQVATIFKTNPFPASKEHIITVFKNGKKEFYQLDPDLYRATLALDKEMAGLFINLLAIPAKTLRAGAIFTPEFMVRNPIRDVVRAMVVSEYGFTPVDLVRGLFSTVNKDDLYWKWKAAGGAHGMWASLDRDYLQASMRDLLADSAKDRTLNHIKNPLELLRSLSQVSEQATRLGDMGKGVMKEGDSRAGIMKAALASRALLDYSRVGSGVKIPNKIIPFFNAPIQDIDVLVRAFRKNPTKMFLYSLLFITIPSIYLYLINRKDDRYKELPQWQKDQFWIIPTEERLYRIPKPFTLGMAFGTATERIMTYIDTQDPSSLDGYAQELISGALPSILPTAFLGWLEIYTNKSFFTGRPIIPRGEERLDPELQYGLYTSETAKLIGRTFSVSPRQADHLFRAYGGGLARYGTRITDALINIVREEEFEKPAGTAADLPLIGAFVPRVWHGSDSIEKFYKQLEEAERLHASTKRRRGTTVEPSDRLRALRKVATDLSKLRQKSQTIEVDKNLTAEQKREQLDFISIFQINMARRAIGRELITYSPNKH